MAVTEHSDQNPPRRRRNLMTWSDRAVEQDSPPGPCAGSPGSTPPSAKSAPAATPMTEALEVVADLEQQKLG